MTSIRLNTTTDTYFQEAWEIYNSAFPAEERRSVDKQIAVMKNSNYHFEAFVIDKQVIGFILWWNFDSFRYVDHFATASSQRNKGFGKIILEKFITNNNKPVLLEVELPESTINQRRIKFYERIGFKLNPHYYEVPSMVSGESPLQLLLMTYPNAISEEETKLFVTKNHPELFKKE
ncbi:GNAT family N-acetyltransferase [Cellulophaga baltica]|uniref:GNAT family N-acetyltransferase n=1 Tax=Cellulophaga TaxID=104264 RepID=UPI001C073892|nr:MULTISPECIES: GNAT family N-acetyltransferase [Cellulophaga]MBU2997110.1 GNAT family N-acetyltransferase [Cellulophaga baltica]MDO6768508.1 GNAT family N-acetyltransferase [Cellulophaga sp. 1_MG-2023]